MTGKLLKYELKSSSSQMLVIWGAMILASILTAIIPEPLIDSKYFIFQLIYAIPPILFGVACIAMFVCMIFIIVIRFYKGLMCEEGYLMHTLPVKEWQLITAKGLSATIYSFGCMLSFVIAICILSKFAFLQDIGPLLSEMGKNPELILFGFEFLILLIFSILKSVYQVYASLAIGQVFDKHRILIAILAYVGISIAITIIAGICGSLLVNVDWMSFSIYNEATGMIKMGIAQAFFGAILLIELAQLAIFHVITERLLTNKLNLL